MNSQLRALVLASLAVACQRESGAGDSGTGDTCGHCPGSTCPRPITLVIEPEAASSGKIIPELRVEAPGLDLRCRGGGAAGSCQWQCELAGSVIRDGDYTIAISAPGYEPMNVAVHAVSPRDCGCCGCCPFSFYQRVFLRPTGAPVTGCCADLDSDPNNCGKCGRACPAGSQCQGGKCVPSFKDCLLFGYGFASCDSYCASVGQACMAACGPQGHEPGRQWIGNAGCAGPSGATPLGSCADSLLRTVVDGGVPAQQCCCGEP